MATELFGGGVTVGIEFYSQLSHDNALKWPRFTNPYSYTFNQRTIIVVVASTNEFYYFVLFVVLKLSL